MLCNRATRPPSHIRFYAGVPIRRPRGHAVGSCCILDHAPRSNFSAEDRADLVDLAALIVDAMELRLAHRSRVEPAQNFRQIADAIPGMIWTTRPAAASISPSGTNSMIGSRPSSRSCSRAAPYRWGSTTQRRWRSSKSIRARSRTAVTAARSTLARRSPTSARATIWAASGVSAQRSPCAAPGRYVATPACRRLGASGGDHRAQPGVAGAGSGSGRGDRGR